MDFVSGIVKTIYNAEIHLHLKVFFVDYVILFLKIFRNVGWMLYPTDMFSIHFPAMYFLTDVGAG